MLLSVLGVCDSADKCWLIVAKDYFIIEGAVLDTM